MQVSEEEEHSVRDSVDMQQFRELCRTRTIYCTEKHTTDFSAAVRRNNSELHNTEKKVLFANCAAHVCLWKPLPHLPSLSLAPADQEEEGRMSGRRSKPSVTFTVSIQFSSLAFKLRKIDTGAFKQNLPHAV